MDFTQDIFIPLPKFEKQAYANLSPNAADWVHDITKMIYEKLAFITQFPTKIKLQRVDEQRGYGYGSIKVGDKIDIPLIIKNFELQAMDVFLMGGEFFPLSEKRIEEVMFNPETFGQPSDVSGLDQSIYPNTYPPHSGKYTYASIRLLDKLDRKVTSEDKQHFADILGNNKGVFASFKQTGNLALVKTAASLTVRPAYKPRHILSANVLQIEKLSSDKFTVRVVSDRLFYPTETTINAKTLFEKFGKEVTKQVLDKGEFTTIQGSRPQKPELVEDLDSDKAKQITKSGKYQVRDIDGDKRTGWVYTNLVDFDLKKVGDKLFTDGQSYAFQSSIAGIASESASRPEDKDEPPLIELEQGKTGSFCFFRGGTELCTIPVTITSPVFDQGTHIRVEVSDMFGRAFIIEITSGVKSITKSKKQFNVYTLPADVQFISVGRKVIRLIDSAASFEDEIKAVKIAKEKDVLIVTCNDGNVFNLNGTNLKELTADARGIGATKAKWYLVSLGLSPSQADSTLNRARDHGTAKVLGTKPLITQAEKKGAVIRDKVIPMLKKVAGWKQDLIKEAAILEDEQVVDKVLALNFLTPENVSTFVEFLPSLEDAAKKLAQLLIAIRVGMKRIPESAAKSAMMGLETVIAGLSSMEALNNVESAEDAV